MSDSTPNSDRSQLSNEQLESLLTRPDLPESERAGIEAELTRRIRDELLQSPQIRNPTKPLIEPTVPGQSPPLISKSSFPVGGCIIVGLIIIGIVGFLGVMFLLSQSRNSGGGGGGGGGGTSYGTLCVTNAGSCSVNSQPVGSSCGCYDSYGNTYAGTVR